ncbi:MAG: hypothetical protein R3E09_05445 [Novosphingobium sp.]
MSIRFECGGNSRENRRAKRNPSVIRGRIRERSRSSSYALIRNLSIYGCEVECPEPLLGSSTVWVQLPRLESIAGGMTWCKSHRAGIAFDAPLHPAVAEHVGPGNVRKEDDMETTQLDTDRHDFDKTKEADDLLSRREEILLGKADNGESPVMNRKSPRGGNLQNLIARETTRSADHREAERFEDVVVTSPVKLKIKGSEALVENVSSGGVKITCELDAGIGDEVPVEFDGFQPMTGEVIWIGHGQAGISLPPDSIEISRG